MTKSELIEAVARRSNITKSRAELVVNCVFDSMTSALERDEGIEIRGFGSFTVRHYDPYDGRNPRTGRAVFVPEKRLPFFKVGKELKALVNGEDVAQPPQHGSGSSASQLPHHAHEAAEAARDHARARPAPSASEPARSREPASPVPGVSWRSDG